MSIEPTAGPPIPFTDAFGLQGEVVSWGPLDGGHIHTSLLVACTGGRYVVQRFNRRVFPDIDAVQENCRRIVRHLADKGWVVPRQVPARSGRLWHEDGEGTAWRAFEYLEGTERHDVVTGVADAAEAARLFGTFVADMGDLPPPPLRVTKPRFHDLPHRAHALEEAVARDECGRRASATAEIGSARALAHRVRHLLDPVLDGLPRHVVHNDAKMANVRFASGTDAAVTVVDLDTVMAGPVLHDVGELVRTVTTHAHEDAVDPGSVDFDLGLLGALAGGYLAGTRGALTDREVASLHLAGPWLAVENGLRFLTDHLEGDHYFPVTRPDQNLDRCRTQLTLVTRMLDRLDETRLLFAEAATR